jgi:CBS domain-containing protein
MSAEPPPAESDPEARTAADLMDRQPPAVLPDALVGDVARLIVERHVSGVPVVARSGEVLGLVTEADLVARHAHLNFPTYLSLFGMAIPIDTFRRRRELDAETRRVVARTAGEIMTEKFGDHTVTEDTSLEDVAERLSKVGLNPLVVLRGDRLAGLITRTDLVRLVAIEEAPEAEGAEGA